MHEQIQAAVKELREKSKKRNFPQSFDVIVNLKEYDLKKSENKFTEDVILPKGRGVDASVVVFAENKKDFDCEVLTNADIQRLAKNKAEAKKIVNSADFFLSEPKLMPVATKAIGQFLGTRGKIPKLLIDDAKKQVANYKKATRIKVKDSPVIQCLVGKENMKDEDVIENVEGVLKFLEGKLPKGIHNMRRIMLKLTMSKPVKIDIEVKKRKK